MTDAHTIILGLVLAVGVTIGIAVGAFTAVWVWLGSLARREVRVLNREVGRLVAQGEVNMNAWQKAQVRYRAQRDELLAIIDKARSELQEVRQTARAREEQIRRQVADSSFGRL